MRPDHALLRFLPYFAAGIVVEIAWYLLIRRSAYPWKETFASLSVFFLRIPIHLLTSVAKAALFFLAWSVRPITVPLNTAWGIALLFLTVEFSYYWMHRADHTVRWMWASHIVHHTPEHIHFASALRLGLTEFISGSWLFFLPLPFFGFYPLAVTTMLSLNLFYQFWLHTDVIGRLGPLEWILNTPSHHRVHHASNEEYLDRNFGGILIIWDRLFGTFAQEQPQTVIKYGLVQPIGTYHPLKLAFHEWLALAQDIRDVSWRDRVKLVFGRPGAVVLKRPDPSAARPTQALLMDVGWKR
ncbi:MAG: sterol desaturase family protein [Alphaproteobacteria bacterium]|nr:sterol desaturase family protein [Alphaproteobacteria bacterium]